jgi:hypothetical protein
VWMKFIVVAKACFSKVVFFLELYVSFFTVWLHDVNHNSANRAIGILDSLLM